MPPEAHRGIRGAVREDICYDELTQKSRTKTWEFSSGRSGQSEKRAAGAIPTIVLSRPPDLPSPSPKNSLTAVRSLEQCMMSTASPSAPRDDDPGAAKLHREYPRLPAATASVAAPVPLGGPLKKA